MNSTDHSLGRTRCSWPGNHLLNTAYHDDEWGVPQHDEKTLFEMMTLEGAQAGLSWLTILNKRENYRRLFEHFDVQRVADFDNKKINALLLDPGIVRHRGKIEATINNARRILMLWDQGTSLDSMLWEFVNGEPVVNKWKELSEIPSSTTVSELMSKRLKKSGFRFVGKTTCYALMQAAGMVNDHVVSCFRHKECQQGTVQTRE
jgi:DNA-3-methyladenine glycosylase I